MFSTIRRDWFSLNTFTRRYHTLWYAIVYLCTTIENNNNSMQISQAAFFYRRCGPIRHRQIRAAGAGAWWNKRCILSEPTSQTQPLDYWNGVSGRQIIMYTICKHAAGSDLIQSTTWLLERQQTHMQHQIKGMLASKIFALRE